MHNEPSAAEASQPLVTIHILRGKATRRSREMRTSTLLIGSESHCDVQMRSADVAGKHCLLTRRNGRVTVQQLDPDAPVLLNGGEIHEADLSHGDKLTIGPFELAVSIEGAIVRTSTGRTDDDAEDIFDESHAPSEDDSEPRQNSIPDFESDGPGDSNNESHYAETARNQGRHAGTVESESRRPANESKPTARDDRVPAAASAPQSGYGSRDLDDLLEGVQRSQAARQLDIDRRERDLQRKLQDVDRERETLADKAKQIESDREILERGFQEQASARQRFSEADARLTQREEALQETERDLEQRRLTLTEELIEFDNRSEAFEQRKRKLLRIRKRLFERQRERFHAVENLRTDAERRATVVDEQRRKLDSDIKHWKQIGEELSRRQTDVDRRQGDLVTRINAHEREQRELSAQRVHLAQEESNLRIKERSLETFKVDLDERKQLLAEREAELRLAEEALANERDESRRRVQEVQHRFEQVEAKALTLEKQEQHLVAMAQANEDQRLFQVDRDRELAARAAELEEKEALQRIERERLERRESELNVREQANDEQNQIQQRKQAELVRLAREQGERKLALDRRAHDLEKRTQLIVEQFDDDRRTVDKRIEELQADQHQLEEKRKEFEIYKDQWMPWVCEVREGLAESAQWSSILAYRNRRFERLAEEQHAQREKMLTQGQALASANDSLQAQQSELERLMADAQRRIESVDAESARLDALGNELEAREVEITQRERTWCEEVKRRRAEMESLAEELDAKRTNLDRQLTQYRMNVQKLRQAGDKFVEQRQTINVQTEELAQRLRETRDELQSQTIRHQQLRTAVIGYVEHVTQREEGSLSLAEAVQSDSEWLAQIEHAVGRNLLDVFHRFESECQRKLSPSSDKANMAVAPDQWAASYEQWLADLAASLEDWTDRLKELEHRNAQRAGLHHSFEDVVQNERAALNQLLAAVDAPLLASAASSTYEPGQRERDSRENDEHVAADVAVNAEDVGKVEELETYSNAPKPMISTRETSSDNEGTANRSTEESLRDQPENTDTVAMIRSAADSETPAEPTSGLVHIGSARVLETVHEGAVIATHRVSMTGFDTPMALRMIAPQWCRDEHLRTSYQIAIDSVSGFRHRHIAVVHGVHEAEDCYGAITDFVSGVSLAELAPQTITPRAVVHLCRQVIDVLVEAQRVGLVHHNLRPTRLMVEPQVGIKIIGYGEPSWLSRVQRCEMPHRLHPYVAPEETSPLSAVDVRADLYSVGKVFWQIVTRGDVADTDTDKPFPAGYPQGFKQLLVRLLSDEPDGRCRSVAEVASSIDEMLRDPLVYGEPWPDLQSLCAAADAASTPVRRAA